ncbi:MAG: lysophospholipid acyltransferase family protein [Saprospiraceae bacterium]|jgi:1-acyl-sn-glycerol-3-phosphate acyltransferase|nr:lysophospholipid acyltransferase family protein [Saprospiraceae bacterium]
MNKIRAGYRFFLFMFTASMTLLRIMLNLKLSSSKGQDYILNERRKWVRKIIPRVGVKLDMTGTLPDLDQAAIFVQNHKSYFDPVTALKLVKAMPVSKAEISSWPLIGFMASYTGVLFVQREDKSSRAATLLGMEKELEKGNHVLIYPEGTTTDEAKTLQFKLGAFRLASRLNIPIIPMSIEFSKDEDAWVGSTLFLPHFFKTFGKKEVYVKSTIGPKIQGGSPEELLEKTQSWIDNDILKIRAEFEAEGISRS